MNDKEQKALGFIAAMLYRALKDDVRFSTDQTDALYYLACDLGGFYVDTDEFDEL